MALKQRLNGYFKNRFVRSVGVLAGGTAFSQAIALLALPLLTRLYTPEEFTVLATYTSVLTLLTVIACLRLEIAIPMPKSQGEALDLLALSVISVIFITFLSAFVVFFFGEWFNNVTDYKLKGYLWLLPAGVFFAGVYKAFQYWVTREKDFKLIAKTRMTQSVSGAAAQIGFGYAGVTPLGLLLGQILNVGAGGLGLIFHFRKYNRNISRKIKFSRLKETFEKYDNFPKYSTWEALTNSAAIQAPVFMIAILLAGPEAGYLMLAMRLLSAPMGLIGGSVAQVYLADASDKYHDGSLEAFTNKTILVLAKAGFFPLAIAGISAPILIPVIFGDEWYRTGILISWMVPWFFMQFITSPVSMALHITGNQKTALVLQFSGFLFRGGSVLFAILYSQGVTGEIYALSGFVFYSAYLWVVKNVVKKSVL